jgi:RNA polymerase sigma-70 factor (ECF subfamily)
VVSDQSPSAVFERLIVPHLDAAYNLARWLMRSDHDAADVVQEASLRALRFLPTFQGGNDGARAWLLRIVRNTAYTALSAAKRNSAAQLPDDASNQVPADLELDPQRIAVRMADVEQVRAAIETLPPEFRETLVLREIEGLSYNQIADVTQVALGTVMSRLSRARRLLATRLQAQSATIDQPEAGRGM